MNSRMRLVLWAMPPNSSAIGRFGSNAGEIMRATADHRIGLAVVWGPLAGYYARNAYAGLTLTPVHPAIDAGVPFVFSITGAVHKRDSALRDQINAAIAREAALTRRLLRSYGVPLLPTVEKRRLMHRSLGAATSMAAAPLGRR